MASLTEVQNALKRGDKQAAAQALKVVLKERPSADAWYLAAKLTSNRDVAMQHLQRALAFDSKHVKSRDMLREMGGTPQSFGATMATGFWPSLRTELERFGENKPFLRSMGPQQRMATAVTLYGGSFAILLIMVVVLLNPPPPPAPPELTTVSVFQGGELTTYLTNNGLSIASVESVPLAADALYQEQVNIAVQDAVGSHPVTLYLYKDVSSIVNDGRRLNDLALENQLSIYHTAVIIYPVGMDSSTTAALETAMSAAPSTLIVS